jgi:hypothetical protein
MRRKNGISRRAWLSLVGCAGWAEAYAVVAGTVFRETGHALAGVEVILTPFESSKRNRKQQLRTNGRGEFAFRVPAAAMEYTVEVKAPGYRAESKRVKIGGDERVDENFILEPVRKEK